MDSREDMESQVMSEIETDAGTSVATSNVSDRATAHDALGFTPYVTAVADFLTHPNTDGPLTLSIEGEWGAGKTSFMAQLRDQLRDRGAQTVGFNAWRHDQAESLWAAFALTFIRQLSDDVPSWWQRQRARLELHRHRFDLRAGWPRLVLGVVLVVVFVAIALQVLQGLWSEGVGWLAPAFGPDGAARPLALLRLVGGAGLVLLALLGLRKARTLLWDPFEVDLRRYLDTPDYGRRTTFIREFHNDFRRIVDVYVASREPRASGSMSGSTAGGRAAEPESASAERRARADKVFVFIDDLDRAEVPRAAELMRGLNLMISESPRLVFILGMDRRKVAAGHAAKYRDLLPYLYPDRVNADGRVEPVCGLDFGYAFIEKFIQLPFGIPRPDRPDIERMIRTAGDAARRRDREPPVAVEGAPNLVEIVSGDDSPVVHRIALMAAPALDYNPRRVKQFINAFRLQTHIAYRTGLFAAPEPGSSDAPLTLERLGKFVAISLRWPRLLDDVRAEPGLLADLERHAVDPENSPATGTAADWTADDRLLELLRHGVADAGADDFPDPDLYSVIGVDIGKLLRTSPATRAAPIPDHMETTAQAKVQV